MYPTEYYRTIRRNPNLVCYWRLNDVPATVATDYAGKYDLNGIYNGPPGNDNIPLIIAVNNETGTFAPNSKVFGKSGRNVEIPDAAPLRVIGDITIEAWILLFEEGKTGYILSKMNSIASGPNPYEFGINAGKLRFGLGNGTTSVKVSSPSNLPISVPLHVIGTSYRGEMSLYINGTSVATAALGAQVVKDAAYQALIGALPGGGSLFNGLIGEVALYNAAMSVATAKEHFSIGRQIIYKKPYYTTFDAPSYS
jgi:hypothetical protein